MPIFVYRQIDGVAMGSPLELALANIFVGYCKEKLFSDLSNLPCISDMLMTLLTFFKMKKSEEPLIRLNGLPCSLHLTLKKNNSIPFLNVHVEHKKVGYETKIYRKPTFTGLYIRWESLTPIKRKSSLVSTLIVHRVLKICSKSKFKR